MSMLESIRSFFTGEQPVQPHLVKPEDLRNAVSNATAAAFILQNFGESSIDDKGTKLNEAFTQADIELALDDRGWLVGGKRMAGELDPLSRQVQINRSRYYWLRDPLAKQAIRLWTDYALGDTGMTYVCDDTKVSGNLDKFMKDRRNRARFTSAAGQQRLSKKLLVDGELFFAVFEDGTIRTIDCLQITDILTDPDDEEKVVAYKRVMTPPANSKVQTQTLYYRPWDYPADAAPPDVKSVANDGYNLNPIDPNGGKSIVFEKNVAMYHVAFDCIERRGNGLLTSCSDWSREHRRFMIARVAIMQALSKFAYKTTVKGGQNIVNSIRAKLESTFAQSGLSGGTQHQPVAAPGANWLQNEGINLEAMPRATGAGDGKTDADQLKLMVSAGTGIMLHYFGDPSTGNLATATAMELPMLKMFMGYQVFWRDVWRDLFSIVLKEGPDNKPAAITITYPSVLEDDLTALAAFLTSLTSVFPEAKVPALLKQCLESANVPDLDEVMEDIEEQRDKIDAQNELNTQLALKNGNNNVPGQKKKGNQSTDPQEQGTLMPDGPGSVAEAGSDEIANFITAVTKLAEVLK